MIKMKTIAKTYYTLLFLLASSFMLAQTYSNTGVDNTQSKAAQLSFLASQTTPINTAATTSVSNKIYIQQIGNNNSAISNTRSVYSNVNLFQRGSNNDIVLDVTSGLINENVFQNGNNHSFIDLSSKATLFHGATIYQSGSNQNLIWYGTNSISEKMRVTMKGKNQTIIIRNIKR